MTKKKPVPAKEYNPDKAIPIELRSTRPEEYGKEASAQMVSPEVSALRVVAALGGDLMQSTLDMPGTLAHLREQAATINSGDMKQAEAMLINQAIALETMFARLTEKGMMQPHMPNLESFMRLALRAQNQCRATLETLATIKNPPIIYAKQVNQTTGPQQINNGQGRESEILQTKLSEGGNRELLPDTRASALDGRISPALATLETINRAEVARGESSRGDERLQGGVA